MTEPIKWSNAPDRTSWGASMRVADIEIDRDHTLTLYCEASQTAKVDAMFVEVERLRMQVVACGVVALADTPDSAIEARKMHPDYRSDSLSDVERRVDECIRLRAEVERLREVAEQALEAMEKATRYMSNSDYIKLNQTIDATRTALKETK